MHGIDTYLQTRVGRGGRYPVASDFVDPTTLGRSDCGAVEPTRRQFQQRDYSFTGKLYVAIDEERDARPA